MSASPRGRAVGIIGTGRVGSVLAAALADAGHPVVTGRPDDITIIAVPDDALAAVVAGLGPANVVAHTSGAHGPRVLDPAVARGARPLALPPAMTLTGRPDDLPRPPQGLPLLVSA